MTPPSAVGLLGRVCQGRGEAGGGGWGGWLAAGPCSDALPFHGAEGSLGKVRREPRAAPVRRCDSISSHPGLLLPRPAAYSGALHTQVPGTRCKWEVTCI